MGRVIAGRFELEAQAGVGGMGVVWRARDRESGERVAVKILEKPEGRNAERFAREAAVLAELEHPSIVGYVAHGLDKKGNGWIAMEWLEGEDLFERVRRAPLPIAGAIKVARAIASALGAAHARGIVHRDVKPENIFLVGGSLEDARMLDFGVARWVGITSVTRVGSVLGTPGYMAPEQIRGRPDIGPPADVFALGCVLHECLTGKPVYPGTDPTALLVKVLLEDPKPVRELRPDVPPMLDSLVSAMLAREASERPPDGAAVARALEQIERGERAVSKPTPAITSRERRLVHLVLAASQRKTDPDGVAEPSPIDPELRFTMDSSTRVEHLADGTVAVAVTGVGAATDQAARAARIALTLRKSLPGTPIALATGRAIVEAQEIPIGEVIDRASALLGTATDDGVRIDAASEGLLGERFEIAHDADGAILRGERAGDAPRTLLGRPAPFVGREREVERVRELAREAFDTRTARAVLITAPAGGGKSRLAAALGRFDAEVWSASGDPLSAGSPFTLLARALRRAFAISEGMPRDVARASLRERVGRHLPANDAARVAMFIGEAIGVSAEPSEQLRAARMDARLMSDQVRRAFEDLARAECAERPLLIVLDDLQWGDRPSLGCVDAALRMADVPLVVLALGRPEVSEVFADLWRGRDVSHVELAPLAPEAAEAMVREVLPDLDSAMIARIVERAGGNPYYLEELLRAVDAGTEALPDTILAMVQTRIEALGTEERRALRAASVIGRDFWDGAVRRLVGADVDRALARLAELELVTRARPGRFADERSFADDPVREAAYAMLTPEDRALGHHLTAAWLEEAGERDPLLLAEHYERGGQPGPAAECFLRAARQALEGDDLDAAIAHAAQGTSCAEPGETLGRLHRVQAEAYMWRGSWSATLMHARQAAALLPAGSTEYFGALGDAAIAAAKIGDEAGLDHAAQLLAAAKPADDALDAYLIARARAAIQFHFAGKNQLALALFDPGADPPAGCAPITAAWIYGARAAFAGRKDDTVEHLRWRRMAAACFERAGDRRRFCVALNNVAVAMSGLGLLREAIGELTQMIEVATEMGLDSVVTIGRHNRGDLLSLLGQHAEGLAELRGSIDEFARQGEVRLEVVARIYAARAELALGHADRALEEVTDALARAPAPYRPYALAVRACALIELGRSGEAFEGAAEAMRAAEAGGELDEGEGLVRLTHARALAAVGLEDEARASAERSRAVLMERASRIADVSLRESYLRGVPDHAALFDF